MQIDSEFQGNVELKAGYALGSCRSGAGWNSSGGFGEMGTAQLLGIPGLWGVKVSTDVKTLLSVQQGPPGPSGLPGGHGFRGPSVSFSCHLILIY